MGGSEVATRGYTFTRSVNIDPSNLMQTFVTFTKYQESIAQGGRQGLGDFVHLAMDPYGVLIKPAALVVSDSVVLAAGQLRAMNLMLQGDLAFQELDSFPLKSTKVYKGAVDGMQARVRHITDGVHVLRTADGPERARMGARLAMNLFLTDKTMHQAFHVAGHAPHVLRNRFFSSGRDRSLSSVGAQSEVAAVVLDSELTTPVVGNPEIVQVPAKKIDIGAAMEIPLEVTDKMNAFHEATEEEQSHVAAP